MAQKAKKDLAKANTSTLSNLHLTSLLLNLAFIALSLLFRSRSRSLLPYFILSTPAFICEIVLERTGRPSYTTAPGSLVKTLKSAGQDLAAEGLTAYMFDVVWVTWGCLILVAFLGNKAWVFWGVVPAYGAWQAWKLLGMARGAMGKGNQQQVEGEEAVAQPQNRRQRRQAA